MAQYDWRMGRYSVRQAPEIEAPPTISTTPTSRFGVSSYGGQPQVGWQPQTATTGITQQTGTTDVTTTGRQWWEQPSRARPEYKIPKDVARKYTRERVSTGMRPIRRGLREALTAAQSAPTGPLRGYLMQAALRGFSGGIGKVVQDAREYGMRLATEEARANWEADLQGWLREWTQRRTQERTGTTTTTGTTTGVTSRWGEDPRQQQRWARNIGFYAKGGPINKKKPYIVGEEGPELFVPNEAGTIIPNPKTQERMKGMSLISRQYGGNVLPGFAKRRPAGLRPIDNVNQAIPGRMSPGIRPTAIPIDNVNQPGPGPRVSPGIAGGFSPSPGPRAPQGVTQPQTGMPWYQGLLNRKRQQTPLRRLI